MKAFWKALGIAALAAAVPVRFQKDETTGRKKFQSLLISVDMGPDEDGEGTSVGINIGEGLLTDLGRKVLGAREEAEMFTDDPAEAAVDPELAQVIADEAQVIADDLQAAADDAQALADDLQAAADVAQAEADADDFDPEL